MNKKMDLVNKIQSINLNLTIFSSVNTYLKDNYENLFNSYGVDIYGSIYNGSIENGKEESTVKIILFSLLDDLLWDSYMEYVLPEIGIDETSFVLDIVDDWFTAVSKNFFKLHYGRAKKKLRWGLEKTNKGR